MYVPVTLWQNSVKDIEQSVRRDIVHKEMNSVNVRLAEFEAALSETGKALQVARVTKTNALICLPSYKHVNVLSCCATAVGEAGECKADCI